MDWFDRLTAWFEPTPKGEPDAGYATTDLPNLSPAALVDPHGKRVYYEYFVGELGSNGHYPWLTRVYCGAEVACEKTGQTPSTQASKAQAMSFGIKMRDAIASQP